MALEKFRSFVGKGGRSLRTIPALAFVPSATLVGYWIGGEAALLAGAAVLPAFCAAGFALEKWTTHGTDRLTDMSDILKQREDLELELDECCKEYANGGRNSACFVIEIEDFDLLKTKHGSKVGHAVFQAATSRLARSLRSSDMIARISSSGLGVCTQSIRRFEVESAFQIAERLSAVLDHPVKVMEETFDLKVSVGLCVASRFPAQEGRIILAAAIRAQEEAARKGSVKIHAYSEMMDGFVVRPDLGADASGGLSGGDISPWFQPQFDTQTGTLIGMEALARWNHPDHGLIPPMQFLDVIQAYGLWHDMTDRILDQSLQALNDLEAEGVFVPNVGVNFSEDDLLHPQFLDRIKWALDKHNLNPSRLCVEILETVVANSKGGGNAKIIEGLVDMGCKIDLDDFGTGHASISSLRAFKLNRIKIDRSFVIKLDQDPEQQKMMQTVLLMAKQLGFETLAEGVENDAELAILKSLGCGAVQGYGLGRPMPLAKLIPWFKNKNHTIKQVLDKTGQKAA